VFDWFAAIPIRQHRCTGQGNRPPELASGTKGKRKIQPVFRRNLTKTEWSLAEQVFNAMQVAYIKAETKEWLRGWLKRAAKHGMSGHNEYWCDTPEKALDFIAFAQCVGIPKERLFFIYRPRKLEDQVCQDIDLNFWSCSLNVAVEHFAVQLQGASGRTSLNGLVGLQVMAANYLAIPELELNKQQRVDSSKKREGSSGFWTALRFFVVLSDEPLAEYYSTGLV
jgi:hypothetical protein